MRKSILILSLFIGLSFLFTENLNISLPNRQRDLNCNDEVFCDSNNLNYSRFVCNWVCKNSHNTIINKCSDTQTQFYSKLNDGRLLYMAFNNYLNDNNFNYVGLIKGSRNLNGINFDYIREDETIGYWDYNGNDQFDIGNTYSENFKRGRGNIIINQDVGARKNIAIHINHPLNDKNTDYIGGYIFENETLKPKWMLTAGAHRYSLVDNALQPNCTNSNNVCGEINYGADVARDISECDESEYTTAFQVYHEVLSNSIDNLYTFSIHGFNVSTDDPLAQSPNFILSNGKGSDGNFILTDKVTSTIRYLLEQNFQNISNSNNPVAVIVENELDKYGDYIYQNLGGSQNPQGKYTNTVSNDDIWVQIEFENSIRLDPNINYLLLSSTISEAINGCLFENNCYGCNDISANNYVDDVQNNDSGYCKYYVYGCTDAHAYNYDSLANIYDGSCFYLGDANFDSEINISDIVVIVEIIMERITPTPDQLGIADWTLDEIVNVVDIVNILIYILI